MTDGGFSALYDAAIRARCFLPKLDALPHRVEVAVGVATKQLEAALYVANPAAVCELIEAIKEHRAIAPEAARHHRLPNGQMATTCDSVWLADWYQRMDAADKRVAAALEKLRAKP